MYIPCQQLIYTRHPVTACSGNGPKHAVLEPSVGKGMSCDKETNYRATGQDDAQEMEGK